MTTPDFYIYERTGPSDQRDVLKRLPRKVAAVLKKRRVALTKLEADRDYSAEYKGRQKARIEQEARDALEGLATQKANAEEHVRKNLARAANPNKPTDKATLDELKAGRVWVRLERQLDAGRDYLDLIAEARDRQDADALAVLRQELPSYLQATGGNRRAAELAATGAAKMIEQAEGDLPTPPKSVQARRSTDDLDLVIDRVSLTLGHAEYELDGTPAPVLVDHDGTTFDPASVD